jgi:ferric-dicitrate binding protein FerR (iron transport regulator)
MLTQNEIEKIGRYINGMAGLDDMAWIEDLFSHGHKNQNLKHHLESDWENVLHEPYIEDVNLNRILDRVHHLIREKESQKRKTFVYRITNAYIKAAAILLLPLIIAGGLYFGWSRGFSTMIADQKGSTAIYAPMGSRVSFHLPDGTKGWLNSGSTLTYSLPFSENRKVALEGEAWFDVFHQEKQPFEISAGESRIKVLGTSFNVCAYLNEKYVEVVLQSGKVEFSDKTQTNKVILRASEQLILQEGRLEINPVDASKYKAWTEGRLIFRGDDMAEVARRIERWYNVKVEIADDDLVQFSFRATFENDPLEDVFKQLSMTSPIEYKIIPRKQLPDGTSEKEKVFLYKKRK